MSGNVAAGRWSAAKRPSRVAAAGQMRWRPRFNPLVCLLAALLIVPAFAADVGSASAVPAGQAAGATVRIVLRPVTAGGRAAVGYHVIAGGAAVDCAFAQPSPVTVSRNVQMCSPSAAYAVACWRAAAHRRALCFFDARHRRLTRYRLQSRFAATRPPRRPVPLDMRLRTGVYCEIRDGGTGSRLQGHPNWYESYFCTNRRAIWACCGGFGVYRTRPVWRVHTAPDTGRGRLVVRRVARAWFVGTRR